MHAMCQAILAPTKSLCHPSELSTVIIHVAKIRKMKHRDWKSISQFLMPNLEPVHQHFCHRTNLNKKPKLGEMERSRRRSYRRSSKWDRSERLWVN